MASYNNATSGNPEKVKGVMVEYIHIPKLKPSNPVDCSTDNNILDESYLLVKHFPDFPLWEYRIG